VCKSYVCGLASRDEVFDHAHVDPARIDWVQLAAIDVRYRSRIDYPIRPVLLQKPSQQSTIGEVNGYTGYISYGTL